MAKSAQWFVISVLSMIGLGACAAPPPPMPEVIENTDEFVAALQASGASIQETNQATIPLFGETARAFTLRGDLLLVYEYDSVGIREDISRLISPEGVGSQLPPLWPGNPRLWEVGRLIAVYLGADGGTILLLSGLFGEPLTPPISLGDEPYPPSVASAIRSLSTDLGVEPGAVQVVDFQPIDWPDSCLGFTGTGEACAEVITPGWIVNLAIGGIEYEIHTDQMGQLVQWR